MVDESKRLKALLADRYLIERKLVRVGWQPSSWRTSSITGTRR